MALTDITRIQGVEIFADSLEWSRRAGIEVKEIFQIDVWNIKTPIFWEMERIFESSERSTTRNSIIHEINIS